MQKAIYKFAYLYRKKFSLIIRKNQIKITSIMNDIDYIPTFTPAKNSKGRKYVKVDDDTKAIMQKITKCFQSFIHNSYVYGCKGFRKGNR